MSDRKLAYGLAVLESPSDDDALTFKASTSRLNRYGFRLRPESWHLSNFNLNPVVLWHHLDFMPPIGRGRASVAGDHLSATVTFDRNDPFAASIESKYRNGFLHAVSVGFDFVDKAGRPLNNWHNLSAEQIYNEAHYDLAEISAVPVPADPGAVRQHHAAFAAAGAEMLELAGWSRGSEGLLSPPKIPQAPVLPGNGDADRRLADLEARFARVLSSLAVIPPHSSRVSDEPWTTPTLSSGDPAGLRALHAWIDPDGDPSSPDSYRFAHHDAAGAANVQACRDALERLGEIPEADRAGVERHLRRHLDEYDQGTGAAGTYTTDAAQDFLAAIRL